MRWARLKFGGINHRWHAIDGSRAACERQSFDYPRIEVSDEQPTTGKLCKHCLEAIKKPWPKKP